MPKYRGEIMDKMVEARHNMHKRDEKIKSGKKSKVKKVKNFFFGCCNNK